MTCSKMKIWGCILIKPTVHLVLSICLFCVVLYLMTTRIQVITYLMVLKLKLDFVHITVSLYAKILFVKHWIIIGFNIKKINIRTWWIVAFYKQHYFQFIWWIFVTECEDGFYNGSCILRCGNCKAGTACDKINGSCLDGCVDLYEPPFCTGVSSFFKF